MGLEKTNFNEDMPLNKNKQLFRASSIPLLGMVIILITYNVYRYFFSQTYEANSTLSIFIYFTMVITLNSCIYWLAACLLNVFKNHLLSTEFFFHHQTSRIVLPFIISLLKIISLLSLINIVMPYLGLSDKLQYFLEKMSSIFIAMGMTWLLLRLIQTSEKLILNHYTVNTADNVTARKMSTQIVIFKRVIIALILILSVGSVLMMFDNMRSFGASVLTTAGVMGLLLTFTAQRSLPNISAGLEIAFAQPIKIGDAIVVENESGTVEEINFRHVIIKLWDWRRLVIPTTYFLEKPFYNLSKEQTTNLIGAVYLYVDYLFPVSNLREKLTGLLATSSLWDGKVNSLQVSNLKERTMELRVLVSAPTPADTWNLQCDIREKLISFIVLNHPTCLPSDRVKST